MASSSVKALVRHIEKGSLEDAYKEFGLLSKNPDASLAIVVPAWQKLAAGLFKASKFEQCRAVCEALFSVVAEVRSNRENIIDVKGLNHGRTPTDAMPISNLAKVDLWSCLTNIQCLLKLARPPCDEKLEALALRLRNQIALYLEMNILESEVLLSTGKKLRSILTSSSDLEPRLVALKYFLDVDYGENWAETDEFERYLLSLLRDLRGTKLYSSHFEKLIEGALPQGALKLQFEFGHWLLGNAESQAKGLKVICRAARLPKECAFAAHQTLLYIQDVATDDDSRLSKLRSSARIAARRGLSLDNKGDIDPSTASDLTKIHWHLMSDDDWDTFGDALLLVEAAEVINTQYIAKEFEFVLRNKQVERYCWRISNHPSSASQFWLAMALKSSMRHEEALKVLDELDSFEALVLQLDVRTRCGALSDVLSLVNSIVKKQHQATALSLREAAIFLWNLGLYEMSFRLSPCHDKTRMNPVFSDSSLLQWHANEFLERKGSDAACAIALHADDPDTALRTIESELHRLKASFDPLNEHERGFQVIKHLSTLGELYQERGMRRQAKHYFVKARETARSKGYVGLQRRLEERITLLDCLQTHRNYFSGADALMPDNRSTVPPLVSDLLDEFYAKVCESRITRKSMHSFDGIDHFLHRVLGNANTAVFEMSREGFYLRHDVKSFSCLWKTLDPHPTETLAAEVLLWRFDQGFAVQENELVAAAQRCTSDLTILRELYSRLVRLRRKTWQKLGEEIDALFVSLDTSDTYMASSLVGLSLRAEYAQRLTKHSDMDNDDIDLFHWHRLRHIKDAARVQRSQVAARLRQDLSVVTISYDEVSGTMILCRNSQDGDIVFQWSIDATRAKRHLDLFGHLMQKNLAQTDGSTLEYAARVGRTEKNQWWDHRFELEDELSTWLSDFETIFFGWRKYLLLTGALDSSTSQDAFDREVTKLEGLSFREQLLRDDDDKTSHSRFTRSKTSSSETVRRSRATSTQKGTGKYANDEVRRTVELLLSVAARNEALPILTNVFGMSESVVDNCKGCSSKPGDRAPLLLCLSGSLQQVPWECLPILSGMPISRIASLPFALVQPRGHHDMAPRAFVVNPERNLMRTEETLMPILKPLRDDGDWQGVFGSEVSSKERAAEKFKEYLRTSRSLMYCGHGAGEDLVDRETILSLSHPPPAMLLIGCSSAARKDRGVFEPNGIIDAYILAGSPLVMGNLWNVTDKDIDRFTVALLDEMQASPNTDLVRAIARARTACKLKMLVGSAVVCFGVPQLI